MAQGLGERTARNNNCPGIPKRCRNRGSSTVNVQYSRATLRMDILTETLTARQDGKKEGFRAWAKEDQAKKAPPSLVKSRQFFVASLSLGFSGAV